MTPSARVRLPQHPPMMIGRVILLLLCLGFAGGGDAEASLPADRSAADADPPIAAAPLLRALSQRVGAESGMVAEFTQANHWVAFDEADSAWGRLTIAPPDRFRLEYHDPPGHLVGGDGQYVWTYVPEEHQVLRAPLAETTGWAELFYRGLAEPAESLAILGEHPQWGRVATVALQPRPEWGLRTLEVTIELAAWRPVGYGYTDEEGNRVSFDFHTVDFPGTIDAGLFRFTLPDGYELFDTGR